MRATRSPHPWSSSATVHSSLRARSVSASTSHCRRSIRRCADATLRCACGTCRSKHASRPASPTPRVVMMLVGGAPEAPLRVALVTTHLPLSAVPAAITGSALAETFAITANDLQRRFGIAAPRIGVCGLNPHAGEGGHLGREEIDVIAPAIAAARATGIDIDGPLPADTIFVPQHARRYDAIVAMYHDQGLPVLKAASFGGGVNVTLGLPFIRTSVDHGTALDLAGDASRAAEVDAGSLYAAIDLAIDLARAGGR